MEEHTDIMTQLYVWYNYCNIQGVNNNQQQEKKMYITTLNSNRRNLIDELFRDLDFSVGFFP